MKQMMILQKAEAWVAAAMAENDPAHDEHHVQRVVELTRKLCQAEPTANAYRAQLLAWLHDMNDDKLASDRGLSAVEAFLQEAGAEGADIAFVLSGIPYISYRKHPRLSPEIPLEIRIVQDADRIDAMGAMGIARTFAYGGAKGRSLEESLQHFDEKLLLLYDLLSTDAAKELAKPRHAFLQNFYEQFRSEQS